MVALTTDSGCGFQKFESELSTTKAQRARSKMRGQAEVGQVPNGERAKGFER
jgi:hypothetical protein